MCKLHAESYEEASSVGYMSRSELLLYSLQTQQTGAADPTRLNKQLWVFYSLCSRYYSLPTVSVEKTGQLVRPSGKASAYTESLLEKSESESVLQSTDYSPPLGADWVSVCGSVVHSYQQSDLTKLFHRDKQNIHLTLRHEAVIKFHSALSIQNLNHDIN